MRNRWGVDVKRGHWVMARAARGGVVEGRVTQVMTTGEYARAYGPTVALDSGVTVALDDVVQTLGPMKVAKDGTVIQNPLSRVKVGSKSQRTKAPATKRLKARRRATEAAPAGFYGNPLARVEIASPSQRPHVSPRGKLTTKPDARLIKRRTKTAKTRVKGVWANPLVKGESNADAARYAELYGGAPDTIRAWKDHYIVRMHKPGETTWSLVSVFKLKADAMTYARAYARANPERTVSVISKAK